MSHEHQDHARGLQTITAARRRTVIATRGTLRALRGIGALADGTDRVEVGRGASVRFADLCVEPFAVPHDACEPAGFRLGCGDRALGYVTDFGSPAPSIREALAGLTALVVEANHDVEMLKAGSYPARLKKRILSPYGHLSNDGLAELIAGSDLGALALLCLAHLSRSSNRPELAEAVAGMALAEGGRTVDLRIASHDTPMAIAEVPSGAVARPEKSTLASAALEALRAGWARVRGASTVGTRPRPVQLTIPFEPVVSRATGAPAAAPPSQEVVE